MGLLKYLTLCSLAVIVYSKDCPKICTKEYFPVCGSDLMTYNNLCLLDKANCGRPDDDKIFVIHNSRCRIEYCPGPCTLEYFPVCGTDGVTYGNICDLENAHCRNPEKKITLAYHGVCKNLYCPKVCTKEYNPVCGSNNKTFATLCTLEASNCDRPRDDLITFWYAGECKDIDQCDRPCPLNFDPVCGSDGVTYPNLCAFETAHCRNSSLVITNPGTCQTEPECPHFCPRIWLPICGSDGKTYASLCELDSANCNKKPEDKITIKYDGECKANDASCPVRFCPEIYKPVCGSDDITYINDCLLRATNCANGPQNQITIKYPGECRSTNCPTVCPLSWNPLCGSNKVTYGNPCQLEVANCNRKPEDQIKKMYDGVCKDPRS